MKWNNYVLKKYRIIHTGSTWTPVGWHFTRHVTAVEIFVSLSLSLPFLFSWLSFVSSGILFILYLYYTMGTINTSCIYDPNSIRNTLFHAFSLCTTVSFSFFGYAIYPSTHSSTFFYHFVSLLWRWLQYTVQFVWTLEAHMTVILLFVFIKTNWLNWIKKSPPPIFHDLLLRRPVSSCQCWLFCYCRNW